MNQSKENKDMWSAKPSDQTKSASPKQIEGEIGQTREAISDDIRALGEKLTPAALKAEAKEVAVDKAREVKDAAVDKAREVKDAAVDKVKDVRDATAHTISETAHEVSEKLDEVGVAARRAGDATWHFVRENALPLSILGVGAGLLVAKNLPSRRTQPQQYRIAYEYTPWGRTAPYDDLEEQYEWEPAQRRPDRGARLESGAHRVSARAQGAMQKAGERTKDVMNTAVERLEHGAEQTRDRLMDTAAQTRDRVVRTYRSATQTSREMVREHPLAVGAALLAIGIGVGALLPATQRENQLLGGTRDRLMGEARSAAQDLGETARETAKSVL